MISSKLLIFTILSRATHSLAETKVDTSEFRMSRTDLTADLILFYSRPFSFRRNHAKAKHLKFSRTTNVSFFQSDCTNIGFVNLIHRVIDIVIIGEKPSMALSCPQTLYATSTRKFPIHG
jgi:hypothetical protein